ncbi:MAG: hypothetical protein M3285_03930 [Actinomycetota bacterium]|nr:hypothetical protein [Actinomycetota bacterium]
MREPLHRVHHCTACTTAPDVATIWSAMVTQAAVLRSSRRSALFVLFVGMATVAVTAFFLTRPSPVGPFSGGDLYVDRELGVEVPHPDDWHLQPFDDDLGMVRHHGFVLSSAPHNFEYPNLGGGRSTSSWDMRRLPATAVVVEISQADRFSIQCRRTTSFPMSLAGAAKDHPRWGSPARLFLSACVEGTSGFGVHTWIGEAASDADTDAAYKIVESIRPVS